MFYLTTTPRWMRKMHHPAMVWEMPTHKATPAVYLTFDDGPHPDITPWVMEQLKAAEAQATFFCIGNNVAKHQEVFAALTKSNHQVGNHTMNHENGWQTENQDYLASVAQAAQHIPSSLFRPPYGKIKPSQAKQLGHQYKIIMWSILSGDFDKAIDGNQCAQNVLKHIKPGSIVVFHDSEKAWPRLQIALPIVLNYCQQQEWKMLPLCSTKPITTP